MSVDEYKPIIMIILLACSSYEHAYSYVHVYEKLQVVTKHYQITVTVTLTGLGKV